MTTLPKPVRPSVYSNNVRLLCKLHYSFQRHLVWFHGDVLIHPLPLVQLRFRLVNRQNSSVPCACIVPRRRVKLLPLMSRGPVSAFVQPPRAFCGIRKLDGSSFYLFYWLTVGHIYPQSSQLHPTIQPGVICINCALWNTCSSFCSFIFVLAFQFQTSSNGIATPPPDSLQRMFVRRLLFAFFYSISIPLAFV